MDSIACLTGKHEQFIITLWLWKLQRFPMLVAYSHGNIIPAESDFLECNARRWQFITAYWRWKLLKLFFITGL